MPQPKSDIDAAFRAVAAWCDGADALAPLRDLSDAERKLAQALARTQCELIRFYGDCVLRGGLLAEVPRGHRELVARYVYSRRQRKPRA